MNALSLPTAHTAGPWHRNIKPATKYPTVWSGRNKHVAYVTASGLDPAEVEANICLIAASPALLHAAEETMRSLGGNRPPWLELAIRELEAAIKQAKGE